MKANEEPEKIYLNPLLMEDGESVVRRRTFQRQSDSQIEYFQTDAFIEKACEWLRKELCNYFDATREDYEICIEDFKKAMKL